MPLKARQITLAASTATPLLVQGAGATQFLNITGSITDPLPVTIRNEDAAAVVWVGGSDVSATQGQSLKAGETKTMNLINNDIPWAFSTGTPIVSVLVGRN